MVYERRYSSENSNSLATISVKIPMVECAIVDGKTADRNWNSLKNLRIARCLSGVRRAPLSPPDFIICFQ